MIRPGQGAHRALARPLIAVAVALIAIAVLTPAAGASPGRGGRVANSSTQQAARFWTPARMRAAKPIDVHPRDHSNHDPLFGPSVGGAPRRIPSLPPSRGATSSSTFEQVTDPTAVGMRENGAIFFEDEEFLFRCSGTSVNAPNFSVVITAGHCVDSGGPRGHGYVGHWIFVPGYRYGQRPFGVFAAKWLDATNGWIASANENFDVGAAVVVRNEKGQRLGDAVGGAGIAWNLKAAQTFDIHGYPAAPPFNGETQRICSQTPFLGHDPESFLWDGPLNLAVDCNVTGGASGGGWTIAGNLLNGVTDYGFPDDKATDYGAYFGKEVARLYKRAGAIK